MALLELDDVIVDYPVFSTPRQLSILSTLANKVTAGRLAQDVGRISAVRALDGVSLRLQDGDRVAIVGRNGSGKTSMLKLMSGLILPDSGLFRSVGSRGSIISLGAGLDPDKTGLENICFVASLLGVKRRQWGSLVEDIADFTELGEFLGLPIRTYSNGMTVRLVFALATAIPRDILIVDEVIGAGDAHFVEKAAGRVRSLFAKAKILVLATHSGEIAEQMCDRAIWLSHGRIVMDGTPRNVWNSYLANGAPAPEAAAAE
jgi:lipopolysaccharide transport system ATP-binding protein